MKKKRNKLILTGVALFGVLALVGLGTFAIYTLSKKGTAGGMSVNVAKSQWSLDFIEQTGSWEPKTVSDLLKGNDTSDSKGGWTKNLTLKTVTVKDEGVTREAKVGECYELRPISTSNGLDWFLPLYDLNGSVAGLSYLDSQGFKSVANINRYSTSESEDEANSNYVYYFDIWVKTDSEDEYELKLNNPLDPASIDSATEGTDFFGTFVLPGLTKLAAGGYRISEEGKNACRSLRIGFLTYDYTDETGKRLKRSEVTADTPLYKEVTGTGGKKEKVRLEEPREFWIMEPNCDDRADMSIYKPGSAVSYTSQVADNVSYLMGADGTSVKLETFSTVAAGVIPTVLPVYTPPATSQESGTISYKTDVDINKENPPGGLDDVGTGTVKTHILRQLKSEWKDTLDLTTGKVTSKDIKTLGAFIPLAADGTEGTDTAGYEGIDTPAMTVVGRNAPQHVRIFIWLEGQDVDCWDSTLNGDMQINLEFRGDIHK